MDNTENTRVKVTVDVLPSSKDAFARWQATLRAQISKAPGFSSLEILSPFSDDNTWTLNCRFLSRKDLDSWLTSPTYRQLVDELTAKHIAAHPPQMVKMAELHSGGATEVYVTYVDSENVPQFLDWHEKVHQLESAFPGFQRVYVQSPNQEKKDGAWVTLVQFDTADHLQNWLGSSERKEMITASEQFVKSRETHQLYSSFGGWFSDRSLTSNPPRWKQTMIILAVLYPVVMVEFLYLAPHIPLDFSVRTFMQNVLCVTLLAWPFLPLAIYLMKWWLENKSDRQKDIAGVALLLMVYAIEVTAFRYASS